MNMKMYPHACSVLLTNDISFASSSPEMSSTFPRPDYLPLRKVRLGTIGGSVLIVSNSFDWGGLKVMSPVGVIKF